MQSQQRASASREAGKFDKEIAPMTTIMKMVDKNSGTESQKEVTVAQDEGIRPDTTMKAFRR